ncbi:MULTISPECIES: efflux RND transporter periplasmic adaptor subunit [unclassified Variovorax]|uniref:efflux RND transporter periplasmic adaptor subunit n=1 Tax=unclassified Variovorax TaxID=663243 RepID=UPI003F465E3C
MNSSTTVRTTAAALLLLALAACKQADDGASVSQERPTVSVVTLHAQSVPLTEELAGRVVASLEAEVRPQVGGIIQTRLFTEGGEVKAGAALYKIDPATYQATYDSAVAALLKAQAAVPSAQAKADRNKDLVSQKAISTQDYEAAVEALAQARAGVSAAQAAVQTAKINLDYTTMTAPISGRIGKSSLTPGALVTAGQATALATIHQLDPINIDLTQTSSSLLNLRQAIKAGRIKASGAHIDVTLKLENGTVYPLTGKLAFAESSVSTTTGSYTLRATFANPDRLLLPGMYVRAVVDKGAAPQAFLVPQRAVSRNARGEATALFLKNGKVEQRVLTAGRSIGNAWVVENSVTDGDQVIVEGSQGVREGDAVTSVSVAIDEATGQIRQANQGGSHSQQAPAGLSDAQALTSSAALATSNQRDTASRGQ